MGCRASSPSSPAIRTKIDNGIFWMRQKQGEFRDDRCSAGFTKWFSSPVLVKPCEEIRITLSVAVERNTDVIFGEVSCFVRLRSAGKSVSQAEYRLGNVAVSGIFQKSIGSDIDIIEKCAPGDWYEVGYMCTAGMVGTVVIQDCTLGLCGTAEHMKDGVVRCRPVVGHPRKGVNAWFNVPENNEKHIEDAEGWGCDATEWTDTDTIEDQWDLRGVDGGWDGGGWHGECYEQKPVVLRELRISQDRRREAFEVEDAPSKNNARESGDPFYYYYKNGGTDGRFGEGGDYEPRRGHGAGGGF